MILSRCYYKSSEIEPITPTQDMYTLEKMFVCFLLIAFYFWLLNKKKKIFVSKQWDASVYQSLFVYDPLITSYTQIVDSKSG